MKTITTNTSKQGKRFKSGKKLFQLAIAGGIVFWITTIVTSLFPIAAAYRAAFSNWRIETVWIASLFMGTIIGCVVSYFLLRFFDKLPAKSPILKSVILSLIALVMATILVDVPMLVHARSDTFYYFLIGVMFNAARFLLLGIAIGYLYKRQGN